MALTALTALAGAPSAMAQACTVRSNIEAIIDDSGSMSLNDSKLNRKQAINQLMANQGNEKKTLGATEFGSDANEVFAPGVIGPNRTAFEAALNTRIQADNGGTDYDAGFNFARTHNPNASARIFLTDGAHNGTYLDSHRNGPPTHVLGLFNTITTEDEDRLKRIASETGGIYRRALDASEVQPAMNDIDSTLNCQRQPVDFTAFFSKAGQAKVHRLTIPRGTRSVRFTLSWVDPADTFAIDRFRVYRGKRLLGRAARARRMRVSTRRGATFVNVKLSRVVRGRLRFRVRARRIGSGQVAVKLTTQAIRSRSR
jgi:von Willebrand factor type A domain